MKYGIVDIGSNTIRLNLYLVTEKNTIVSLLNKKTMAGLASYVNDGQMTKKGADKVVRVLNKYKKICTSFEIDRVFVFATAALRNAKNSKEVLDYVERNTGQTIDLLSGTDEANFGFRGISMDYNVEDGYIVDIGGGSAEITIVDQGKIEFSTSVPVGSLSLFKDHVKKVFPKENEIKKMEKEVKAKFQEEKLPLYKDLKPIYGVGGSIRACGNLAQEIFDLPDNNSISAKAVKELKKLLTRRDKETIKTVLKVAPDRIHTIIPGIVILSEILSYTNAVQIYISKKGVREGYLTNVLDEEEDRN